MRKSLFHKSLSIVVGLMVAGSLVAAQTKSPTVKVKQQITLSQDVKVGSTMLKQGMYEVSSKGEELTFRHLVQDVTFPSEWNLDMKEQPVVVTCTVTTLPAKNHGTSMETPEDNGVAVLKTLSLDGTNVKFTIGH